MSAAIFSLQACVKSDPFASTVEAVTVSLMDNALRAQVMIDFRSSSSYHIEYWQKGSDRHRFGKIRSVDGPGRDISTIRFLYPRTEYCFRIILGDGSQSKLVEFKTGSLPSDIPEYTVDYKADDMREGYLMQWEASDPGYVTFCDYDGRIVWYQAFGQAVRTASFDPSSGRLAVLMGFADGENSEDFYRVAENIVIADLDGNVLLRRRSGAPSVMYPHHEFSILPDGNLLFCVNTVREFDLSAHGGGATTPVYGDGFVVMSPDLSQEICRWDCLDYINPVTVDYIDPVKFSKDYVHANSVVMDSMGNFYMTFNRLSELLKINGRTGEILYRAGVHGDVVMDAPFPEGGLHAAYVLAPDKVMCYSNGSNVGHSSALVYEVDEETHEGRFALNVSLPSQYSSANRSNVIPVDDSTLLFSSTVSGKAVFTDMDGNVKRVISRSGISYRAYWFENIN